MFHRQVAINKFSSYLKQFEGQQQHDIAGIRAIAEFCDLAIEKEQLVDYANRITALEYTMEAAGIAKFTIFTFANFLKACKQVPISFSVIVKYQAAILHWQLSRYWHLGPGEEAWASRDSNQRMKKIMKGYAYEAGEAPGAKDRGSLGPPEIVEMRTWLSSSSSPERFKDLKTLEGLEVVVHAALRRREVELALCEDYNPVERILTIKDPKGWNADKAVANKKKKDDKWIISDLAHEFFVKRISTAKPKEYLFDVRYYKASDMKNLIVRAKTALGWPEELDWNTLHTCRHGGDKLIIEALTAATRIQGEQCISDLKNTLPHIPLDLIKSVAKEGTDHIKNKLISKATAQSKNVARHYGRSNAERLIAMRKGTTQLPAKVSKSLFVPTVKKTSKVNKLCRCGDKTDSKGACTSVTCPW